MVRSSLTRKQKKFCDIFLSTGNAHKAMDEAGYKFGTPTRIFDMTAVGDELRIKGMPQSQLDFLRRANVKKDPNKELTIRELKFCNNYLATGDAKRSFAESGYSLDNHRNRLSEIIKKPKIKKYLNKRKRQMELYTNITFDWKIKKLKAIIEAIVGEEETIIDKDYVGAAITAIKVLNEMQGHNAPTSTIVANINDDDDIKKLRKIALEYLEEKKNGK